MDSADKTQVFPRTFKDDLGHEWTVDITVSTLKRVRLLVNGFTFDDLISTPAKQTQKELEAAVQPLRDFLDDTVRFSEVLYAILKPQAEAKSLTHEQFDDGFVGHAIGLAKEAFLQALMDFFPQAPKRMMTRGLMEEAKRMTVMEDAARRRMEAMAAEMTDENITKLVNEKIDEVLKKPASDGPEKPAA